jgi:hypothetical protein
MSNAFVVLHEEGNKTFESNMSFEYMQSLEGAEKLTLWIQEFMHQMSNSIL